MLASDFACEQYCAVLRTTVDLFQETIFRVVCVGMLELTTAASGHLSYNKKTPARYENLVEK